MGKIRAHHVLYGGMGGHVSVVSSLTEALDWEHTLTFFGIDEPASHTLKWSRSSGIVSRTVRKTAGLDLEAFESVFASIEHADPDVLFVHSVTALPAGLWWRFRTSRPVIVVDHTAVAAKSRTEWLAVVLSLLTADGFVALTDANVDGLIETLPLLASRIRARVEVISNGISTERFSPSSRIDHSTTTIVMLARFCEVRDHIGVVEAIARLIRKRPDLGMRLRVVLAGDGATWAKVSARIDELHLGDVVSLPGVLDESEVVALLNDANIYLQWSFADSMSTAVMQAMSCERPVIATQIPGMNNLVIDGVTGVLLPPRDIEGLVGAIVNFMEEPAKGETMGRAGRKRVVQEFSSERMATRYSALVDRLMSFGATLSTRK